MLCGSGIARAPRYQGLMNPTPHKWEGNIMQSSFRPATRRKWLGEQSEGDRRDGDLKLGWTKPLPSAWPMGIDCWPVFGRGAPGVGSERVGLLCRIAVPGVTYEGVGVMRSVPQIFFGMSRLATLLLSLGSAKLVQHGWISMQKQSSSS